MLNPVQTENALPGTTDWVLTNPATNREIEGYASLTSVNCGNAINFFISTAGPYTIDIYRMGWYGGAGARKMTVNPIALTGTLQPIPAPTADGLFECNWSLSHTLSVENDWVSGVYVAKLTQSSSGKQSYIIFVVRDDDRASDYLYQSSATTYQAYNNWPGVAGGGKSLYDHNSPSGRANRVSFNRPYAIDPNPDEPGHLGPATGIGAGEFFTVQNLQTDIIHSAAFEYNMVRFLERGGFDVTYCTNIDTHANGQSLRPDKHKAFLSVGHDEYWSLEMRDNVEEARDSGVHLGFFGANIAYWQIRLESSVNDITKPYRTMICYKYDDLGETIPREPVPGDPGPTGPGSNGSHPPGSSPSIDPVPAAALNPKLRMTVKWRDPQILRRPEDALIGVMFDLPLVQPIPDNNIVVTNASHWVFDGTGLQDGQVLSGLLGYEVDRIFDPPPGTIALAQSPAGQGASNMTIYTAQKSGAIVFATGSLQWSWGLDDYNSPNLRPARASAAAQQITRNVLDQMTRKPKILIPTASAKFVGEDNTTQGNWKANYGADGYNVLEDATKDPDYAQVLVGGQTGNPWERSTSDVRGLEKAGIGSTDRIAAFRLSETSFTIDINLKDGQEHQVAVYCLDWELHPGNVRSQRIEVLDADTSVVLDTRAVNAFSAGRYLVWQLKGHVLIRITHTGIPGSNAVISGLFFDPGSAVTSDASATFVGEDNTTQGNWKAGYGAEGYNIIGDVENYPAHVPVSVSGTTPFTEKNPKLDVNWLQKDKTTDPNFSSWFSETNFTIDINLTDGQEHRVAVYCLDWDGNDNDKRSQRIEVLDAGINAVLDTRAVNAFGSGRYLVWQLKGHVLIRITHTGNPGSNAVISGLFFGPGSAVASDASATFIEADITTQGNWKGVYGAKGFNVIGDVENYPAHVPVLVSGATPFTEKQPESDVNWLQKDKTTDPNFSSWFSETNFTIDINLSDGQEYRVAVYCLDWDEKDKRSQKIEVLDAATNDVLDTRDVDAFSAGRYLVWQLKGHVKFKVTHEGGGGSNAVVSGLFFD